MQRRGDGREGRERERELAQAPPGKWRHKRSHGRNHPGDSAAGEPETDVRGERKKERERRREAAKDGGE